MLVQPESACYKNDEMEKLVQSVPYIATGDFFIARTENHVKIIVRP